ncbi:MAG: hypothetical protein HY901_13945 [Deltaproteobacteria bacterium]|nr:hypothetical protein [Deltaproteobacteria bacterium]
MGSNHPKKRESAATATPRPELAPPARYLARPDYQEAYSEAWDFLNFVFFRLREVTAELAIEGSHRKWADQCGCVIPIDELAFDQSDDPLVRELGRLHEQVQQLHKQLPIPSFEPSASKEAAGALPARLTRPPVH